MIRTLALHLSPGIGVDPSALILTHSLGYPSEHEALAALVSAIGGLVHAYPEPSKVCCVQTRVAIAEARYCALCASALSLSPVPVSRFAVLDFLRALSADRGERRERRLALSAVGWTAGGVWLPDITVITGVEALTGAGEHPPFRGHTLHVDGARVVALDP